MVGIVLVNYNNSYDTVECVKSILNSTFHEYHIVIVDNNSNDNSILDIKKEIFRKYDNQFNHNGLMVSSVNNISLIHNPKNAGFAGGNNIGIKYLLATYLDVEYIWCLNNDTVIKEDTLSELYINAIHSRDGKIGIYGSKLMYYYTPNIIQSLGGIYNKYSCNTKSYADGLEYVSELDLLNFKPDFIVGASMFVDVNFIKEVGYMCEDYFLYFEELDWVLRGEKLGWKIKNILTSVVYHKDGSSTRKNTSIPSEIADLCMIRNRLLFTYKFNKKHIITVIIFVCLTIFKRLFSGHIKRAFVLFKAMFLTLVSLRK